MTLFPDDYLETIPLREIQEEVNFWMEDTWERHFWKKWKLSDKIHEKTKDIKEALDKHLWDKTEGLKTKFWYLLFALCNAANEKWIDLAEAFETVKYEIDDRIGDENIPEDYMNEEELSLIWFEIKLEKK